MTWRRVISPEATRLSPRPRDFHSSDVLLFGSAQRPLEKQIMKRDAVCRWSRAATVVLMIVCMCGVYTRPAHAQSQSQQQPDLQQLQSQLEQMEKQMLEIKQQISAIQQQP